MTNSPTVLKQLENARNLRKAVDAMSFDHPVIGVYDPLDYAWKGFDAYVHRYGHGPKRVLFLGMNPGPWGMAQTGVPFGEITTVRDWLGIEEPVGHPDDEHPSYPIQGLDCRRSEVSGRRLWGLFKERFSTPEEFFKDHFVVNYCPLLFLVESIRKNGVTGARNLTPDKLPASKRRELFDACDAHLRAVTKALNPTWIVAIGTFAEKRAIQAFGPTGPKVVRILHPSPASPMSNRAWPEKVTQCLQESGVWPSSLIS